MTVEHDEILSALLDGEVATPDELRSALRSPDAIATMVGVLDVRVAMQRDGEAPAREIVEQIERQLARKGPSAAVASLRLALAAVLLLAIGTAFGWVISSRRDEVPIAAGELPPTPDLVAPFSFERDTP